MNKNLLSTNKQLFTSFTISFTIHAAIESGLFEIINNFNPNYEEIKSNFPKFPALNLLVKILQELELIDIKDDRYILTDGGTLFTKQNQYSLVPSVAFAMGEGVHSWMRLSESMNTGEIPFKIAYEKNPFDFFSDNPDSFKRFSKSMRQASKRQSNFKKHYFEGISSLIDVGCGDGSLLQEIKNITNNITLTGFDLPYAVENARKVSENNGIEFIEGDFFVDKLPTADAYLLSRILHDWDDEKSKLILKKINVSMGDNSKLFVLEKIMNMEENGIDSLLSHFNVWIMCGGKERTYKEFIELFEDSGFKVNKTYTHNGKGLFELNKI